MKFLFFFLTLSTLLHAAGIEDAKTYHSNSSLQWGIAMETLSLIPLKESERVLDVGCGDGKITALLATKVPHGSVVGVDVSESMINFASLHYPKDVYLNLSFQRQDAANLPFENQFDRVVSFSTLHWVIDQKNALKGIYRALVSGGKASIQTYGKAPMNVTRVADSIVHTEKWAPYFPSYSQQRVFFSPEEYRALLESVGFRDIQLIETSNNTPFPNRQALIDFLKPLLTFIRHLPLDLQKEFIEEEADKIIEIAGPSQDGAIHFRTCSFQISAIK